MYWVSTISGEQTGPYEDYGAAYFAATINFGFTGWTITQSVEINEG